MLTCQGSLETGPGQVDSKYEGREPKNSLKTTPKNIAQENVAALAKHARLAALAIGAPGHMGKIRFKALAAILTIRRHSKQHVDWTLAVAIFSTIVTIGLVALYIWEGWTH
jgi:hypothetical protein